MPNKAVRKATLTAEAKANIPFIPLLLNRSSRVSFAKLFAKPIIGCDDELAMNLHPLEQYSWRTSENSVMTKFSLPHHPGPESLSCEGHDTACRYYQCLMYAGL